MQTKSKVILVSHVTPDFDSSLALWLLQKFVYFDYTIQYKFVPLGQKYNSKYAIHVDCGDIDYDHHSTSDYTCSSSLVLKNNNLDNNAALKQMVDFALKVDHGLLYNDKIGDFDILNIIQGLNYINNKNNKRTINVLFTCYDAIYKTLQLKKASYEDINTGITFLTKYGKGIATLSTSKQTRFIAHREGYHIYIYIDEKTGFRGFTAPGHSEIDYTKLFNEITKIEPQADWFLHSSRQLLLCGSLKAPNKKLSNLSLQSMVDLFLKHYS